MKISQESVLYSEFAVSLLFFIIYISEYISFSFYYYPLAPVYCCLFLAYVLLYILLRKNPGRYALMLHAIFAVLLVLFIALFLMPKTVLVSEMATLGTISEVNGIYIVFILFLYFIFSLGAYAYSVAKKRRLALLIFAVGIAVSLIIFAYIVTKFQFGDEILLAFNAIGEVLSGGNPYTTSIANQLYANFNTIGGSVTTSNNFIGYMDYPALYFLSLAPFYFASAPTLYNLGHTDLGLDASISIVILLIAMAFSTDKKKILGFRFEIVVFLSLALSTVASIATFLMLGLIILAYAKLESKYAFVPIGLALSMQQEVWLPAVLLLLYSLNNYGWKKGMRDICGALAIFLLINGYFIYLSPTAFFSDILIPIGNAVPFNASPIGYLFLDYHVLLSLTGVLIIAATAAVTLAMLYWNRKELIPVLSVIPLFFMFHSLTGYFTFYIFFILFVLLMTKGEQKKGWLTKALRKRSTLVYFALVIIVVAAAVATYESHLEYVRNFNFSVSDQNVSFEGNYTIYTANLLYRNMSNATVFFYLQGYSENGSQYLLYGIHNESLIGTTPLCGAVTCLLNLNRIELPQNASSYSLRAVINGSNESSRVTYMHAIFYNGEYVYETKPVHNSSS